MVSQKRFEQQAGFCGAAAAEFNKRKIFLGKNGYFF